MHVNRSFHTWSDQVAFDLMIRDLIVLIYCSISCVYWRKGIDLMNAVALRYCKVTPKLAVPARRRILQGRLC